MKRSPLQRRAPDPDAPKKARKPLRRRSKKMAKVYREERVPFVKRILDERGECEACPLILTVAPMFRCGGAPVDVHEVKTRGRGGDFLDEDNVLAVCRASHDWIGNNQRQAHEIGLLLASWEDAGQDTLRRGFARMMERTVTAESGCVEFQGYRNPGGYGVASVAGKSVLAHRLAFVVKVGPIGDGLLVCHRCDNRACVNWEHLFTGTHADNSADMVAKRRSPVVRGECSARAKLSDDDVRAMASLAKAGTTLAEIGRRFGCSGPHVSRVLGGKRRQWTDGLDLSGVDTSQRDPATDAIVAMRRSGASTKAIAAAFGKNPGTVWRILKRAAPGLERRGGAHDREAVELELSEHSWGAA